MFQINIDGVPGPAVRDIRIEARDSIYAFVTVRVNPDQSTNPFLVRDSLVVELGSRNQTIILEAWGQNARFLRNTVITRDTRFDRRLPYVILGGLQIAKDSRLTVEAGSRIYLHADAPIVVDGSLIETKTWSNVTQARRDEIEARLQGPIAFRDLPPQEGPTQ